MKIISAANPKYANAENTIIILDVTFDKIGTVPFAASSSDVEKHGRDLFERAVSGEFGSIAAFVPRIKTQAELEKEASDAAKAKLAELDAKSIRDLRAYIAARADAPQTLKDYETAAIAERAKVK